MLIYKDGQIKRFIRIIRKNPNHCLNLEHNDINLMRLLRENITYSPNPGPDGKALCFSWWYMGFLNIIYNNNKKK